MKVTIWWFRQVRTPPRHHSKAGARLEVSPTVLLPGKETM